MEEGRRTEKRKIKKIGNNDRNESAIKKASRKLKRNIKEQNKDGKKVKDDIIKIEQTEENIK